MDVKVSEERRVLEEKHGRVWTTSELQEDFTVTGFSMNMVVVKRKSDGEVGSMAFYHSPRPYLSLPRYYHSFMAHESS